MSFWSCLGELALLEWLFGSRKQEEVKIRTQNFADKHLFAWSSISSV